jgi:uncharacterized protein YecT (DUF1311 family)
MTDTVPQTPPPPPDLIVAPTIVEPRPGHSRRTLYLGLAVAALLGVGIAGVLGADRPKTTAGPGLAIAVQPAPKPAPVKSAIAPGPLNGIPEEAASLPANPPPAQPINLPAPPSADMPTRAATANPTFDCDGANNRAERMICGDAGLAAADRRMDQAFQQALEAGVPFRVLQRQQRAWLRARNDAAFDGRDAVAAVYQDRIDELRQMAGR